MLFWKKLSLCALASLIALVPSVGCGDDDDAGGPGKPGGTSSGGPPWGAPPPPVDILACDPGTETAPPDKSTEFLLITEKLLAKIKADAAANAKGFSMLKANVERYLTNHDGFKSGAENAALMYVITGDVKYATSAYDWAKRTMGGDLRDGSYLSYGDMARTVALVLNWAKAGLTIAQQRELADWLEASTNELWFANQGSHWGISDTTFSFAGNNYRMAFIEGTAFTGYALRAAGDPRGQRWVDLAADKIERPGGVLAYIDKLQSGGDWLEGTNYGERSKQRLYRAMAAIASMGGKNYFRANPFFANSIQYAIYQAQPGNGYMYPGGDLSRSSANEISPYEREYVQIATYWLCESPARRLGHYYLQKVIPSYQDDKRSFDYGSAYYLEALYGGDGPAFDVTTLPLSYRAAGSNWINARSGWDEHATSVSISGAPVHSQSHQHLDMGAFVIWKDKWLAVNPETFGGNGPFWPAEANQGLFVPGRELRADTIPGLTHSIDKGAALYAQVDMSSMYQRRPGSGRTESLMNEHTREIVYLRPDTVFVFDRVDAKPAGAGYSLRFHFPAAPVNANGAYGATNGPAGIAIQPLISGAVTVATDADLGSKAHRIEEAATGPISRYLNVVQVGGAGVPAVFALAVGTPGNVRGAIWNNTVVVFSDVAKGAPVLLPFTYTVPGTGNPAHMLINMTGSVNVTAVRAAGTTTVTVAAGTQATADSEGVVVVTP